MTLEEFREDFANTVGATAVATSDYSSSAFVASAVDMLEQAGEVTDFQSAFYRGTFGRKALAIDGFAFDNADGSLRLFVSEYTSSLSSLITNSDVKARFSRVTNFVDECFRRSLLDIVDESAPARALVDELSTAFSKVSRIRCFLVTDALYNGRGKEFDLTVIGGVQIDFHVWDISRFYRLVSSLSVADSELDVNFCTVASPNGILCLRATEGDDDSHESYLSVIPGSVLADVYDEHGSRLLEGNVRAFLSAKGKINRGIKSTVLQRPKKFFSYNNGLSVTASSVSVVTTGGVLYIQSARNLQIVNGGQTTASLSATRRSEKSSLAGVFVAVKLSIVGDQDAADEIQTISRCANSQNKVSEADFFSNSPFHRAIEKFSRRIWAPAVGGSQHETKWFYERARGQYVIAAFSTSTSQRKKFEQIYPRAQLFTKTDLAKSENSWSCLPHKVSAGAQTSFLAFADLIVKQWASNTEQFNEAYYREAVARLILFRVSEKLVSQQTWYNGGYRANIVTYAIAKLAHEVSKFQGRVVDWQSIWIRQAVDEPLQRTLITIMELVYRAIMRPKSGTENITQWCKKELCWATIRDIEFRLPTDFVSSLVSVADVFAARKEDRNLQALESGLDAQTEVMRLGTAFWGDLFAWARSSGMLIAEDEALCRSACREGWVPLDRQARRLLLLKRRLEAEGFVYRSVS